MKYSVGTESAAPPTMYHSTVSLALKSLTHLPNPRVIATAVGTRVSLAPPGPRRTPAVECSGLTTPISCWAPNDGPLQPTGVVFGACLGSDDNVNVALTVDLTVGALRYDVAMYINLDGGSALAGAECAIVPMKDGPYGDVTVATTGEGTDNDGCPDFTTKGTLTNFAFAAITLKCADTYSPGSSNPQASDGLLDFDIAISWQQNAGYNCYFDTSLPSAHTGYGCQVLETGSWGTN